MAESFIVTDLGYGDAGKGTTVDYLVRHAASSVVVRHSGGAQAAHNVVTPHGRHHTFAQFGSGSFVPGSRTHLSRFMMVNPSAMLWEAKALREKGVTEIFARTTVDRDAPILTPWHAGANQLREIARGFDAHGSCGVGIGELQMDLLDMPDLVLRAGDIADNQNLKTRLTAYVKAKVARIRETVRTVSSPGVQKIWESLESDSLIDNVLADYEAWRTSGITITDGSILGDLAARSDRLVFEGSQGVLLDEWYGFHPYTTWSTTTSENAETLLGEIGCTDPVTRLGVLRAYMTRHGNGPFVTEDSRLTDLLPEAHNTFGRWMGAFRVGHVDLVALRYAVEVTGGVDALVVTGLDRSDSWRFCNRYQWNGDTMWPSSRQYWHDNWSAGTTSLIPGTKGDLVYQEQLTTLMKRVFSPQYGPSVNGSELLTQIEDALGAPVSLASYGPTATDKKVPVSV